MMNDDLYLLASAYADGEVTPVERALAEADPAVMAEVARVRALREALGEIAAPADAARAAMIAAAMGEFDVSPAAAPEPVRQARPPVVAARRPTRWFTWERTAGLAAAAVAVVAIGAVVTNGGRGGDDDSASENAATAMITEAADSTAALERAADQEVTMLAPATAAAAATQAPAVMAAEPADGAPAPADAAGSAGTIAVIESPEQLAAVGLELRAADAADSAESDGPMTTTATGCTFAAAVESPLAIPEAEQLRDELPALVERVELLAVRDYRVGPGDVRPALIAVDLDTGQAFVLEPIDCALLAVGPRP